MCGLLIKKVTHFIQFAFLHRLSRHQFPKNVRFYSQSDDFTPIRGAMPSTQSAPMEQRQIPPYNGFGSEEDSLNSCLSLLPRPPKRDFARFMEYDRRGMDSHILRFLARLDTDRPIESERTFIVNFYLADGTVSVFEPIGKSPGKT
jgi:DUF1126 PH-like domain